MNAEELIRVMQKRRSVRRYSGEPVPMEKLNLILQAGMMAPSGRAIRPWELAVVGDEEKSDVWTEDCCCVMENMHLMASALGVGSCWIQCRERMAMDGETTEDYVRTLLQYPSECRLEAILSLGMPEEEWPETPLEALPYGKIHINKY